MQNDATEEGDFDTAKGYLFATVISGFLMILSLFFWNSAVRQKVKDRFEKENLNVHYDEAYPKFAHHFTTEYPYANCGV